MGMKKFGPEQLIFVLSLAVVLLVVALYRL